MTLGCLLRIILLITVKLLIWVNDTWSSPLRIIILFTAHSYYFHSSLSFLSSFVYSAPFWSLPFLLFSTSLLSSLQLLPLTSFLINRILSHLVSHWIFCWCLFAHHFTLCVPFLTLDLSHCIYTPTKKVFEGFMILFLLIMHVSVQEIYSSLSENGEDCDAKVSDCMQWKLFHRHHSVL